MPSQTISYELTISSILSFALPNQWFFADSSATRSEHAEAGHLRLLVVKHQLDLLGWSRMSEYLLSSAWDSEMKVIHDVGWNSMVPLDRQRLTSTKEDGAMFKIHHCLPRIPWLKILERRCRQLLFDSLRVLKKLRHCLENPKYWSNQAWQLFHPRRECRCFDVFENQRCLLPLLLLIFHWCIDWKSGLDHLRLDDQRKRGHHLKFSTVSG